MSRVEEALRRARVGAPLPESVHLSPRALDRFPVAEEAAVKTERDAARDAVISGDMTLSGEEERSDRWAEPLQDLKLVTAAGASPSSVEQYRRLAAALLQRQLAGTFRTVMITSALPREGKTLTTVNLALTLSESYKRRVLLIDADLRRPSVHELLAICEGSGLAEALRGRESRPRVVRFSNNLSVLPGGRPTTSPLAGLTSARMKGYLEEAVGSFDFVIVDTPPIGLLPDARVLASAVDGVLLVVAAGSTPLAAVQEAAEELPADRLLGVVLNKVDERQLGRAGYYRHYYSASSESASS